MKSKIMHCIVCNKETSAKCSGCQSVFYCSPAHQKENWKEHKKDCSPMMVIEDHPEFGKQWVAGRDIEAGTLLLTELPTLKSVHWPPETPEEEYLSKATCLACGKILDLKTKVYKCGGCSWPLCGEECEKNPIHSENECKVFPIAGFYFPPAEDKFINPNRIDLAIDIIRATHLKRADEKRFHKLINLQHVPTMDLPEETKGVEKVDAYVIKCQLNFNMIGMSDKEVMALPWIRRLNGFRFEATEDRSEIHCTYIKASKFSNSCTPNCSYSIRPPAPDYKLQVRTAVHVHKGEPLTIAYSAMPFAGTSERQEKMRDSFFICKCKRCVDPAEMGTYMSAITCQSCFKELDDDDWFMDNDTGFLLPEDPLSLEDSAVWKCNRCSKTRIYSSLKEKINKLERSITEGFIPDVLFYDTFVEDNMGKVLHRNHYIILKAVEQLTRCMGGSVDYKAHKLHVLHQLNVNDTIFPGLSYWRAVYQLDLVTTMKCLTTDSEDRNEELLEEIDLCKPFLKEAMKFYKLFKDDIPDVEERIKTLKEIKAHFAEISV